MKKFILIVCLIFFAGCAHVVSQELRDMVDKELAPAALFKNPDVHKGKIVMLGGMIASSKNAEEGTYIEVVEKPLDASGEPRNTDISHGRFLIFYDGFLDTAIYSKGREVTVVGEVLGKKIQPLGDTQYPFPLIKSKKLYLFEKRTNRRIPIHFGIGILHAF